MTEQEKSADESEPQLSILSVSKRWWHVCVILLCVQTLAWMAFIWSGAKDSAGSYRELIETMVYGSSRAIPLFIVLSLTAVLFAEFIGALKLVLAEYLKKRFEKRGEARGEARERAAWMIWYRKMKEAEARGELFDEPPPSEKR